MADVTYRSSGVSPGANSTTCVIVKPAGLDVGDLMVAHISAWSVLTAITPPANWNEAIAQQVSTYHRAGIFWKIADAADAAATNFTFTVALESNIGAISAWTGFNTTTPIGAISAKVTDSNTTAVVADTITPAANSMILLLTSVANNVTCSGYAIAVSDPTLAEAYDINTASGSDTSVNMAYGLRPQSTATGSGTATLGSAGVAIIAFLLSISPVVAGGWTHIAKVNGVAVASIAKVNGVLVANIAKFNGVAV